MLWGKSLLCLQPQKYMGYASHCLENTNHILYTNKKTICKTISVLGFILAWKFIIHSWENDIKLRMSDDTCWEYLTTGGRNNRNLCTEKFDDLYSSLSIVTEIKWKRLESAEHKRKSQKENVRPVYCDHIKIVGRS